MNYWQLAGDQAEFRRLLKMYQNCCYACAQSETPGARVAYEKKRDMLHVKLYEMFDEQYNKRSKD